MRMAEDGLVSGNTRRRRGAQLGNSNRLKHGLYSRDAKARRAGVRHLAPLMDEALAAVVHAAVARRDLNAAGLTRKKKREIDNRIVVELFQSLRSLSERAAEMAPALFEPLPAPAPRRPETGGSNGADAPAHSNHAASGYPLPPEHDGRMPGAAFDSDPIAAENGAPALHGPFERRPPPAAPAPDAPEHPIRWWTRPQRVLR